MEGQEFIQKLTTVLNSKIGTIIGSSILKNNLVKLKKDVKSLTPEDCKILVANIVQAVSIFETAGESKLVQSELEKLLKEL